MCYYLAAACWSPRLSLYNTARRTSFSVINFLFSAVCYFIELRRSQNKLQRILFPTFMNIVLLFSINFPSIVNTNKKLVNYNRIKLLIATNHTVFIYPCTCKRLLFLTKLILDALLSNENSFQVLMVSMFFFFQLHNLLNILRKSTW